MNEQPEALRIAYVIEGGWDREHGRKAAAELRRLHEENEAHRQAQARIYTALKTDNPNRDEWPALIAAQHDRITTLETALRQAVEALELEDMACRYEKDQTPEHIAKAITTAKQALGEQT